MNKDDDDEYTLFPLKVPRDWIRRFDTVVRRMNRSGEEAKPFKPSRLEAMRTALQSGLKELEKQYPGPGGKDEGHDWEEDV